MTMGGNVSVWWTLIALGLPFGRSSQKPEKLLRSHLGPGASALDLGCGRGNFSLGMARLVGEDGKVLALDTSKKTLNALAVKARRAGLAERIETRLCVPPDYGLEGLEGEIDFGLCFYLLHRVEDKKGFLALVRRALRPGAGFLLAEPTYHVRREQFVRERAEMLRAGFVELPAPRMRASHTALYSR